MYKVTIIIILLVISLAGFTACTKKESPQPPQEKQTISPGYADIQMPSARKMKIIIPDDVRERWKGVVLTVVNKQTRNIKNYNISLGGVLAIPDSTIEVHALDFLPDLKIEGNIYTTTSSSLLNPAIHVKITEDGQAIFKGWLFQKFPSVHPFKHQRFSITLKEPLTTL